MVKEHYKIRFREIIELSESEMNPSTSLSALNPNPGTDLFGCVKSAENSGCCETAILRINVEEGCLCGGPTTLSLSGLGPRVWR